MINLILMSLSLANPQPIQTAQFKPCVWPNVCNEVSAPAAAPAEVAQFKPCVWPNVCKNETPAPVIEVAQFTTCQWPNKCGKKAA
ncbi:MAG: hypothetical protein M0D55_12895 [Elusimicrobiota bacterium]|nr:MAG: hypothetical protein M0D55_12895 [Elusimicrobiota bacterium]